MPTANEELHYDENTLKKVYACLLAAGIFGQQAVDVVNHIQNQGILFREVTPKRRGRPRGTTNKSEGVKPPTVGPQGPAGNSGADDAWTPKDSAPTPG